MGPDLALGGVARQAFFRGESARNRCVWGGRAAFLGRRVAGTRPREQAGKASWGVKMAKVGDLEFRGVFRTLWVPETEGFIGKKILS